MTAIEFSMNKVDYYEECNLILVGIINYLLRQIFKYFISYASIALTVNNFEFCIIKQNDASDSSFA